MIVIDSVDVKHDNSLLQKWMQNQEPSTSGAKSILCRFPEILT